MKSDRERVTRAYTAIAAELEHLVGRRRIVWQAKFALSGQHLEAAITKAASIVMAQHAEAGGIVTADEVAAEAANFS